MRSRTFVLAAVTVTLLVAGVLSHFASGSPDGLSYVAQTHGFLSTAGDSLTGGWPLADYTVDGLGNDRLSGGIAGVVGCAATFLVVALATRRRA